MQRLEFRSSRSGTRQRFAFSAGISAKAWRLPLREFGYGIVHGFLASG
jgi:hypothetical protein